jgi:DNA-binding NarL/FixJ family response regulator
MIRVLVIDDHPIVREGLVTVLADQPEIEVVGAAGSAAEARSLLAQARPEVALLDLELPDVNGLDALPTLLAAWPDLRILVFTAYDGEERVQRALEAGAKGYLLKGVPVAEIVRAVQRVHRGGVYLEARVAAQARVTLGRATSRLTERERHVLRQAADGLSNKQIAHHLGITERTVKFHLTSIFLKLDAENRAQAVALAIQRGLI